MAAAAAVVVEKEMDGAKRERRGKKKMRVKDGGKQGDEGKEKTWLMEKWMEEGGKRGRVPLNMCSS